MCDIRRARLYGKRSRHITAGYGILAKQNPRLCYVWIARARRHVGQIDDVLTFRRQVA